MIKRKMLHDTGILRVSYTFNKKYVFTLKTLSGSVETTGRDVEVLRTTYWHKFGEELVDFAFEQLKTDYNFIDAVEIAAGSTILSNQGEGTGTAGLVVKWVADDLSDNAAIEWHLTDKTDAKARPPRYAIVTAEHVVRQYSNVQAPIIKLSLPSLLTYAMRKNIDIANFADVRTLNKPQGTELSTYYSNKCENVHYDIALCTLRSALEFDLSKANVIDNTFSGINGNADVRVQGEIKSIEGSKVLGRKCMNNKNPFFLLGHYNRSYGLLLRWESLRGVNYIVCELSAKKGDSGGLLFEIVWGNPASDCDIRAVGILSKVVKVFKDEPVAKAGSTRELLRQEAWFTPLNYLNLDLIELIRTPSSSSTTPSGTTQDACSETDQLLTAADSI